MRRRRALGIIGAVGFLAAGSTLGARRAARASQTGRGARLTATFPERRRPTAGPLRVHPRNPRYFVDRLGHAVYLTGSHHWANLQDRGASDPPPSFDFGAYLDFLDGEHHNFIRLWAWEQAQWAPWTREPARFHPLPFARTGPGLARDGGPRFDLRVFDEAYFSRLRERVVAARERGIYVGVMLFEGWSIDSKGKHGNPWPGHPFHRDNNVNGIDGDPDGDGEGREAHTLAVPAVTEVQLTYVRKVVDTLNDLDNVLWEVSNESHPGSTAWQYAIIRAIKTYEASLPAQHPVGMTAQYPGGTNAPLFASPADWISPVHATDEPYRSSPPAATGDKVVVSDTDHLWGVGGDAHWVWKSFTRGLHTIYMDPLDDDPTGRKRQGSPAARRAMGDTLRWALRVDLAGMAPRPDLASSGYCLANPGLEYLVYVPSMRSVIVDLSAARGQVAVEWFDPATGALVPAGAVDGGAPRFLTAPFSGAKVLGLRAGEHAVGGGVARRHRR
jgi:hypothetical protein